MFSWKLAVSAVIIFAFPGMGQAATIVYLPNSFSQQVAANNPQQGNIWSGISQSITAID